MNELIVIKQLPIIEESAVQIATRCVEELYSVAYSVDDAADALNLLGVASDLKRSIKELLL